MVPSTESLAILAHFCFRLAWYLEGLSPRIYSVGRISFDYTKKPRLFATQDIFSIIQHDYFPPSPTIRMMMTISSIRGYLDL